MPVGFAYGVVVRAVLLARQRGAASAPVVPGAGAALVETPLRRADRWLAIVLLTIAGSLGLARATETVLVGAGIASDEATPFSALSAVVWQIAFGMAVQALIAVIPAAALTTQLAVDRAALRREAAAIDAETSGGRRVRRTRALSWTAYGVWSVLALGCAVALAASHG
ncbi:hypothetical protein [Amnibacterium setariae]|uniref:Uncharacterized protein n=1 Tax=Amnibacterium setariae TaxID=2306585 RepID=A0A3A1U5V9_9MICO|nr:hypothetical protein [Amnibacterium setariae]RIX28324.1 hypothetical protein D1781_12820 [Amnibacterium setariae]